MANMRRNRKEDNVGTSDQLANNPPRSSRRRLQSEVPKRVGECHALSANLSFIPLGVGRLEAGNWTSGARVALESSRHGRKMACRTYRTTTTQSSVGEQQKQSPGNH